MPADLTREALECLLREVESAAYGGPAPYPMATHKLIALLNHARSEPTRLAAARQEGVREGIEMAAQWHDAQAVRYAGNRAQVDYLHREYASRIRSLSPAPAEPSAPVAPKDVPGTAAGWMETARHYAKGSEYYQSLLDQIGQMFGSAAYTSDDGSVQDSILRAKVPELVAARISALEAENAQLRRELEPLAREAERYDPPEGDGTENLSEAWDSRFTIGHLRRARALLRGGADAE